MQRAPLDHFRPLAHLNSTGNFWRDRNVPPIDERMVIYRRLLPHPARGGRSKQRPYETACVSELKTLNPEP
jgi:hypothetical protein